MSDAAPSGFGSFIPGFDFLQNLAKGTSSAIPQVPNLGQWVAPTLSVEDLDKRIDELKNVQFWLEQNSRALAATIQALEVQKMTLATLKGMHLNLGEMAAAFTKSASAGAPTGMGAAAASAKGAAAAQPAPEQAPPQAPGKPADAGGKADTASPGSSASPLIDPLQLWGSLTQQFQAIAASALKDVARQSAPAPTAAATARRKTPAPARSTTDKTASKTAAAKPRSRSPAASKKPPTR